jgi:hypothetical protein
MSATDQLHPCCFTCASASVAGCSDTKNEPTRINVAFIGTFAYDSMGTGSGPLLASPTVSTCVIRSRSVVS